MGGFIRLFFVCFTESVNNFSLLKNQLTRPLYDNIIYLVHKKGVDKT